MTEHSASKPRIAKRSGFGTVAVCSILLVPGFFVKNHLLVCWYSLPPGLEDNCRNTLAGKGVAVGPGPRLRRSEPCCHARFLRPSENTRWGDEGGVLAPDRRQRGFCRPR